MKKENENQIHQIFSEFNNMKSTEVKSIEDIDKDSENVKEDTIESRFANERKVWKDRVSSLSKRIRDINTIAELQVDVYSARQELVEYYHYISSLMGKRSAIIRKRKKERSEHYLMNYNMKLSPKERDMYVLIDIEDDYIILKELENHSNYISATLSTIDNIIYGIKHRITLEEYKRRL